MNMGSIDNQNLWPSPSDDSNDCSLRICNKYCPQLCHLNPPPPPEVDDSSAYFPRCITAVVVILTVSFVIATWFAIVKRHFQRTNSPTTWPTTGEPEENLDEIETPRDHSRDQSVIGSTGLDEAVIKTITVCNYQKGDGQIEGTECAVCLSEFQENESLRLLPNCVHAFHLPCIDTWLKSHSNCPLCRVDVNVSYPLAPPVTSTQTHNIASLEVQQPNDLIFVVDDHSQEVVLTLSGDGGDDDDDDDDVTSKSP